MRYIWKHLLGMQGKGSLKLSKDSLVSVMAKNGEKQSIVSLCSIVTMTVVGLVFLIGLIIFLLHDVLLFNPQYHTTPTGALVSMKSCDREISQYLFNTSELWADTGIQISEKDRVKITASGGCNSSFAAIKDASDINKIPKYVWADAKMRHNGRDSVNVVGALMPNTYVGALLYRIDKPSEVIRNPRGVAREGTEGTIMQVDTKRGSSFRAGNSGTLYLAINDILFDSEDLINYYASELNGKPVPNIWFADNIGQLMVTVDIQHSIHNAPLSFKFWFRLIENTLDSIWTSSRIFGPILCLIVGLLLFFLILPFIFFVMGLLLYKLLYLIFYSVLSFGEWIFDYLSKILNTLGAQNNEQNK